MLMKAPVSQWIRSSFELALMEKERNGVWVTDAMPDLELPSHTSYTATWKPS